jgi:basic membrane protein A
VRAGWAVMLCAAALSAGCGGGKKESAGKALHVGMVFDVGGLGDKSFNDLAYQGLLRARDELGITFEYFEPTQSSDRESALRLFAQGDAGLIVGVGFLFSDDIRAVARDFPEKHFVCIDYSWTEGDSVPPNLVGIKFREEEGSFLVGALAAMVTGTGVLGFVGGMDIPLIHKFEAGYRAGAIHQRPDVRVLVNYAGVTGDAFKNPAKGKELALAQYDQGADIIYHASGSTGLGVFEAARQKQKLAIGVDADQSAEAPGLILTSMVKRVDVAVYDEVQRAKEGRFEGGVRILGLKDHGVDYVRNESNARWITPERRARLDRLTQEIIDGTIRVPAE